MCIEWMDEWMVWSTRGDRDGRVLQSGIDGRICGWREWDGYMEGLARRGIAEWVTNGWMEGREKEGCWSHR